MKTEPGLYIISTPIGNIQDISIRALDILNMSNFIFCEDTRITSRLLQKFKIFDKKLEVYNDHSTDYIRNKIKNLINEGHIVSLVSDAGTPLISDPGFKLVNYLYTQDIKIDVIPGACAAISALVISGLPTNQFYFAGFLEKTEISKKKQLEKLKDLESTLIFYETANRISSSVQAAYEIFGNRKSCVIRELTKLYQTRYYMNLQELDVFFKNNAVKGEIIFMVEGKNKENSKINIDVIFEVFENLLSQNYSPKSASDILVQKFKGQISKKDLYHYMKNKLHQ